MRPNRANKEYANEGINERIEEIAESTGDL